jgi:Ferritin-like domain
LTRLLFIDQCCFPNLDAQVLNFALSLELLERAFYEHGLSRYSSEAFKKAGYPAWVRGRFEQIYEHEKTHVQFLESALTAAGIEYVKPCEYVLCVFFFLPLSLSCFDY